jgi:membrane-bound lytic murein transglycosylase F
MKYPNHYDHYFQAAAAEFFYQILPWQWFKAQAIAESGLDPKAVSPCGAIGVMQLMPGTSADMAKKLKIDNSPHVPQVGIRMGIAYARQCWDIWKKEAVPERIRFMLASYNAGPGNIIKAQRLANRNHLYPDQWLSIVACLPEITGRLDGDAAETINYVKKIETIYAQLIQEKKS